MNAVKLPAKDQRVMLTGLFAGLWSNHVCVVPDATDEEVLAACNADERRINPSSSHVWTRVMRTEKDFKDLGLATALPGPCAECPPRIHIVVR